MVTAGGNMDQAAFIATQWLRQAEVSTVIGQSRIEIGGYFGWSDGWYDDDISLGLLHEFLEGRTPALLDDLPEAVDEDRQRAWIASVAETSRYSAPEWDENYDLYYRYDKLTQLYEWAESETAETWMTQEAADELGQSREQDENEEPDQEEEQEGERPDAEAEPSGYSESAWDDDWQMLYRTGPGGEYQFAYSDDRQTIRPGTEWLRHEDISGEAPVASPAEAQPALAAATEAEEADVAMALVAPANLAALASELGVDESLLNDLIDGDFQRLVDDEIMALADAEADE
jgi:hypothetical protein